MKNLASQKKKQTKALRKQAKAEALRQKKQASRRLLTRNEATSQLHMSMSASMHYL